MLPRAAKAVALSLLLAGMPALAWAQDCAFSPHDPSCKLDNTLHLLYWIAAGLTALLLLVAGLAYSIYRKNKSVELTRRDR